MLNVSVSNAESMRVSSGSVSTRTSVSEGEHRLAAQLAWATKFAVAADSRFVATLAPPSAVYRFLESSSSPDSSCLITPRSASMSSAFATRVLWKAMFSRNGPSLGP